MKASGDLGFGAISMRRSPSSISLPHQIQGKQWRETLPRCLEALMNWFGVNKPIRNGVSPALDKVVLLLKTQVGCLEVLQKPVLLLDAQLVKNAQGHLY